MTSACRPSGGCAASAGRAAAARVARLLSIACACTAVFSVARTAPGQWSEPALLFHTADGFSPPTLAVDPTGRLVLAWSVVEGTDPKIEHLYVASRNRGTWSSPQRVVDAPTVDAPVLVTDPYGELHLLWAAPMGRLQYSPLLWDATTARVSGEILATGTGSPDLSADARGRLYLVYAGLESGPTYRASTDGGGSWAAGVRIAEPSAPRRIVDHVRLEPAPDRVLHAVWTEYELLQDRSPSGVFYARSNDDGATWSPAVRLAGPGANEINVATAGDQVVHVVWNGSGGDPGRFHRWSGDGGVTWSPARQIVDRGGANGLPQLAVDSADVVHLVTAYQGAIWHASWDGAGWRQPECISCGGAESAKRASGPAAIIAEGNVLEIVYWQGPNELLHAAAQLPSPRLPPAPAQAVGWRSDRFWHRDLRNVPALFGILASIALVRILRRGRERAAHAAS